MAYPLELLVDIFSAFILFILPGWSLLSLLVKKNSITFLEKFCLSGGVSICLYPLLLYICDLVGIRPGALTAWIPVVFGIVGILVYGLKFRKGTPNKELLFPLLLTIVALSLVLVRLLIIRPMLFPAWGDSVQHAYIVQLLLDNGGLFESWAPYAPIRSFSYHFGFHGTVSVWAWITGLSASQAVLICGQILNILAIFIFYPIVFRLTGNRWAGLASILVAGFLSLQPGYYVNWGRYPQLAGHIILLAALWCFDTYWKDEGNQKPGFLALIFLLTLGMGLTHVRVSVIYASAFVAWTLRGIWLNKKKPADTAKKGLYLAGTLVCALFCLWPWAQKIAANNVYFARITNAEEFSHLPPIASDISIWGSINFYYANILWILAAASLLLAWRFRRHLFWPLCLWMMFSLLAANPHWIGLAKWAGWLNNEVLVFAFYIPLALSIGWILGAAWQNMILSRVGKALTVISLLALLGMGWNIQHTIVDPFFQLITRADLAAFRWIKSSTPRDSRFLVNGFLVQQGRSVVGSDAGWWIPLLAERKNTIPPLIYAAERLDPSLDKKSLTQIVIDLEASQGDRNDLREILCREKITHIFLGEKRGSVGYDIQELIPESWLQNNPDFSLIFQEGKAQVWSFDFSNCENAHSLR